MELENLSKAEIAERIVALLEGFCAPLSSRDYLTIIHAAKLKALMDAYRRLM